MKVNQTAVVTWVLAAAISYAVGGVDAAVWGFIGACGFSLFLTIIA